MGGMFWILIGFLTITKKQSVGCNFMAMGSGVENVALDLA